MDENRGRDEIYGRKLWLSEDNIHGCELWCKKGKI